MGGPDSGKSNFLARLWLAIQSKKADLFYSELPEDLQYIEDISSHLLQGKFAPRTDSQEKNRLFSVSVESKKALVANIIVPDMHGEIWDKAVASYDVPKKWMDALSNSFAAVLFLRIRSESNIQPLDWVNSRQLINLGLGEERNSQISTQVSLLELLRFIDQTIKREDSIKPKVALILTAWDLLNEEESKAGPEKYLKNEFPLLAGRISDIDSLEVKVFGCSIVGGDLGENNFMEAFLEKKIHDQGYIVYTTETGDLDIRADITKPIDWILQ